MENVYIGDLLDSPFQPRQPKSERPAAGKSYTKMTACRNGECEGVIIKETDVSYPNPDKLIGGPPVPAHYKYSACCNVCAIVYDVTILERSLGKTAP